MEPKTLQPAETNTAFQKNYFNGLLIQGKLTEAIRYLAQFPEQDALYQKYQSLYKDEQYLIYDAGSYLNEMLLIYQKYYREIFYLHEDTEHALENMRQSFIRFFHMADKTCEFDAIEDMQIKQAFTARGFHFLGGRTCGYFGPYIWRTTKPETYHVTLPDSSADYRLLFLDGFLMRSWLDYISFGTTGTGGWADENGTINCVKKSYDLQSEDFTVSLLKHEAQHTLDLSGYKNMPLKNLEYRAKLVELIYSEKRNLLLTFLQEADGSDDNNGHAAASAKISEEFTRRLLSSGKTPDTLSIQEIQAIARELFARSTEDLATSEIPQGPNTSRE